MLLPQRVAGACRHAESLRVHGGMRTFELSNRTANTSQGRFQAPNETMASTHGTSAKIYKPSRLHKVPVGRELTTLMDEVMKTARPFFYTRRALLYEPIGIILADEIRMRQAGTWILRASAKSQEHRGLVQGLGLSILASIRHVPVCSTIRGLLCVSPRPLASRWKKHG